MPYVNRTCTRDLDRHDGVVSSGSEQCFLGLGNDEAYHSLYAGSSFSGLLRPPADDGLDRDRWPGDPRCREASGWAFRLGFIVMFAGSTWLLARLTTRYYGERIHGFIAALALNLTGYYGLAASTFALPDGPLLFFWLLTMDRLSIALDLQSPRC